MVKQWPETYEKQYEKQLSFLLSLLESRLTLETGPHQMAEAPPDEKGRRTFLLAKYKGVALVCVVNVAFWFLKK